MPPIISRDRMVLLFCDEYQGKKKENRRFGSGGEASLFPGVSGSTAFVSLSGEGPLDGEWTPASSAAR